ncbi:MAG: hypothetical protein AAF829_03265 [Pseudomonadota bacterium]
MTPKDTLTETRIIALIETYGANLDAWPEGLSKAAAPFFAVPSDAIAQAISEEAELDALLSSAPSVEAPDHLYAAILEAAPSSPHRARGARWFFSGWGTRVAAGASALAMGLTIGLGTAAASAPTAAQADDPFSEIEYFIFDPIEFAEGFEDIPE